MKETIDKLKERPKDERTAVAGGVAALVALLLLVGWGFFFLKRIVRGESVPTTWGVRSDIINTPTLRGAADEFEEQFYSAAEELKLLRDQAARIDQYAQPDTQSGQEDPVYDLALPEDDFSF